MSVDQLFVNRVFVSGKIIGIFPGRKGEVKYRLRVAQREKCGDTYEIKRDKDGNIVADIYTVRFYGKQGEVCKSRFQIGDFACVVGVAQTVRDAYTATNSIEIWGLKMFPKAGKKGIIPDSKSVSIVGRVESSIIRRVGDRSRISLTVYTKTVQDTMASTGKMVPTTYRTFLTVSILGDTDVARALVKGDWISMSGRIREVENRVKNGKRLDFIDIFHVEKLSQETIAAAAKEAEAKEAES